MQILLISTRLFNDFSVFPDGGWPADADISITLPNDGSRYCIGFAPDPESQETDYRKQGFWKLDEINLVEDPNDPTHRTGESQPVEDVKTVETKLQEYGITIQDLFDHIFNSGKYIISSK